MHTTFPFIAENARKWAIFVVFVSDLPHPDRGIVRHILLVSEVLASGGDAVKWCYIQCLLLS